MIQAVKRALNRIDAGLALAGLLVLFVVQALLQPGLPTVADLPIHIYRTVEFGRAWGPGVIVPRWAPDLAFGYGYPLFIFAPPLPYLLGLALLVLNLPAEIAFKLLLILSSLLYAGGMYLLARELLASAAAGLVAAAAYLFAPFALREALLYGGNLPQYLAIAFFPWTLWAMARAGRTPAWRWLALAGLGYSAVLLSHLFQALLFTAVAGAFGLLLWAGAGRPASAGPRRRWSGLGPLASLLLGLLLSAFFWLPALTERLYTRAQAEVYLAKSPFFVRYPRWPELVAWIQPLDGRAANPYVPLTLGLVTLLLAGLGLLAGLWLARRRLLPAATVYVLFFAGVAAAGIFMTLPASRPLWEAVSILQVAEFPWRTLGLANLGLAFLAGAALLWLPARLRWPAAAAAVLALLLGAAPYLYPTIPFTRYGQVTLADQADYERRSQSIGTTTLGEYLPQTVRRVPNSSPLLDTLLAGQLPERLDRASLPAGATAALLEQSAVTHRYRLDSPAGFSLRLFQFHFPGWRAFLDGRPLPVRPEEETGLLLMDVPAGQHNLIVHFGETPVRVVGLALSGLALLAAVGAGLWRSFGPPVPPKGGVLFSILPSGGLGGGPAIGEGSWPETRLSLASPAALLAAVIIVIAALGLAPGLRPLFTITSPPGQALPARYPADVKFDHGLRLIGYDLSRRVIPAGEELQVVLYWETGSAPLRLNLQPFVHLDRLNDLTTVAGSTNYTPGDPTTESNVPTFHWDNNRYVRDEHDLLVPAGTPPLAYALRAGWIDPDDGGRLVSLAGGSGDTAYLTTLNVSPGQKPAPLAQPLAITFSHGQDAIRLTGFELNRPAEGQLRFSLSWQAGRTPAGDYTVFAQLLDRDGGLAASFDRPPLDGAYPTSTWLPGQAILDPRHIPLEGVPAGDYRLIVGLYDPLTRQRLVTSTGTDFVELAVVNVGRSQLEVRE